ncbi:MAG: hypothetical protein ACYCVD_12625 [Desulfitobacteriaceae bacterium]
MLRKLSIIVVWTLVGLIIEFALSLQRYKVSLILAPVDSGKGGSVPIVRSISAEIPGNSLQSLEVSHAKDYLAYLEKGG